VVYTTEFYKSQWNKFKLHKFRFGWKRLTFRFLHLTVSEHLYSFEGGGSISSQQIVLHTFLWFPLHILHLKYF